MSPLDHATVTGVVPITVVAGVTLASGVLSYYPVANPNASVTLNASVSRGRQIGTLDTTTLANGTYDVLLYATDTAGQPQKRGVWVVVAGDYRPDRVTTTVSDLVVPAPGLPITISRTYDSLVRSASSDFGYGWSLGITPVGSILQVYSPAGEAEPGLFGTLQVTRDGEEQCRIWDKTAYCSKLWILADPLHRPLNERWCEVDAAQYDSVL